jgi:hypothetical protein
LENIEHEMAFDAFISYSSKDKTAANAACATLESAGVRCWIAPRDITPGGEYGAAIIEGIDQCRVMVLIFSSSANESRQVHREIERAVSKGVTIVPVRIDEVTPTKSMEYFLGAIHWLDALTPPIEQHLQQLAETVKAILKVDGQVRNASAGDSSHKTSPLIASRDAFRSTSPSETARMSAGADRSIAEKTPPNRWLFAMLGGAVCIALLAVGGWLYHSRVGVPPATPIAASPQPAPVATSPQLAPLPASPQPAPSPALSQPTPIPASPQAVPAPAAPQAAPKQAAALGDWAGTWAGVWFVPSGKQSTVTIALKGNSIAGTVQWRETDDSDAVKHRADGALFDCKVTGSTANCELTWDYTDRQKDLKNHATGNLTLDGDHLTGEFHQDEAEPTWRTAPTATRMHVGAVWRWDLVRRK